MLQRKEGLLQTEWVLFDHLRSPRACRCGSLSGGQAQLVIVKRLGHWATEAAAGFASSQMRRISWALASPKTPRIVAHGGKSGGRYRSSSSRCIRIPESCHIFSALKTPQTLAQSKLQKIRVSFLPTRNAEEPEKRAVPCHP